MAAAGSRSLRQHAALDAGVQIVARFLNLGLGVIVTALLVRALGEAGFGQWSTILIIFPLFAFFMEFGLTSVVVREGAADPSREGEWVGALVLVQAVMAVPAMVASLVVLLIVHEGSAMLTAGVILLATFPFAIGNSMVTVFRIRMRNTTPMVMLTINSLLWLLAVIVIDRLDGGMVPLAIAMCVINASTTVVTAALALRLVKPRMPTREALRHLITVGTPLALAGIIVVIYARIDQILVFSLAGSADAGVYNAAYKLIDGSAVIPASVLTTLAPILAASWPGDRARLLRTSRLALEYLTVGGLGVLAFTIAAADPIVRLLYTDEFADAAAPLRVLTGAFVVICFSYLIDNVMLVLGMQRRMLLISLLGLAVNVPANLILIPEFGFMAAAWTTLGTQIVVVLVSLPPIFKVLNIRRPSLGRLWQILAAATVLCAVLMLLGSAGAPLLALCGVAAVGYPALLIGLRALRMDEIRELVLQRRVAV